MAGTAAIWAMYLEGAEVLKAGEKKCSSRVMRGGGIVGGVGWGGVLVWFGGLSWVGGGMGVSV